MRRSRGLRGTDNMISYARDTTWMHRVELGDDELAWLNALPYVYADENLAVAHANFANPQMMGYIYGEFDARHSFICRDERMLFVGHTHLEALYGFGHASDSRFPECRSAPPHDFELDDAWRYLVNVGSVGYPRVTFRSCYVLYDSTIGTVKFRHLEFDFEGYISALQAKSIPVPGWINER